MILQSLAAAPQSSANAGTHWSPAAQGEFARTLSCARNGPCALGSGATVHADLLSALTDKCDAKVRKNFQLIKPGFRGERYPDFLAGTATASENRLRPVVFLVR